MRGKAHSTTLPEELARYVEGLAEVYNLSISQALAKVVREHFDQAVQAASKESPRAKTKKLGRIANIVGNGGLRTPR